MISVEDLRKWADEHAIGRSPSYPRGWVSASDLLVLSRLVEAKDPLNFYYEDAKDYARHAMAKGLNVIESLDEVPAANFQPVVYGHWVTEEEAVERGDYSLRDACSVCGHCDWDCTESESFNYCPNCGARMERKGVMKSAIWQVGGSRGPTFRSYEDAVAYIRTRYGSLRNVFLRKIEDKEREGEEKNEKVL